LVLSVALLAFLSVIFVKEVPLSTGSALPVGADTEPSPPGHR